MKEITMFYLESCPHCIRARNYMEELKSENPAFSDVPVKMVEERKERELANSFDYYYVPCYYIDGEKVSEGAVAKDDVENVFRKACEK